MQHPAPQRELGTSSVLGRDAIKQQQLQHQVCEGGLGCINPESCCCLKATQQCVGAGTPGCVLGLRHFGACNPQLMLTASVPNSTPLFQSMVKLMGLEKNFL